MAANKRLAIIIINWNNSSYTLRILSQISSWTTINPLVIVVDNNSLIEDVSNLEKSELTFQLVRNTTNKGYGAGNNAGISKAIFDEYHFIMLLNSDTSCPEECISALLNCMDNTPNLGVIGPLLEEGGVLYAGGRNIGFYSTTRIPYKKKRHSQSLIPVEYVPGTVLIARRNAFERVGLLEEEFFFSGEIADFCRRMNLSGMICAVFTGCKATHYVDIKSKIRQTLYNYYILRNRFLFVRRHYPNIKMILILRWAIGGLIQIGFALIKGRKELARALWKGLEDGLSGKYGDRNELFLY